MRGGSIRWLAPRQGCDAGRASYRAVRPQAEDQNYTLFNYVNEVNQEIEKLEDMINVMRGEMSKAR
jgi:hypothetical protein